MFDIRLPKITGATEREQLSQVKSYLYQLAEQLQFALNSVETATPQSVAPAPTVISSGGSASAKFAVDFVAEIGVWNVDDTDPDKGYWRYRKWKSGALDMNGFIKVTPTTEGTFGTAGIYYSEVIYIDLPFSVENFQFTGSSSAYHIMVGETNSVDGNDKQIRLRLYSFTDFASLANYNVHVHIVASGKYK